MGLVDYSYEQTKNKEDSRKNINESEVLALINERNEARKHKDYKKSDEIRNKLEKMGIKLQDIDNGTTWEFFE